MSKPRIAILSVADWAGSQYQACQAIRSRGAFECRHITLFKHPYQFPVEVCVPLHPNDGADYYLNGPARAIRSPAYAAACEWLQEADLIHLWNTYPGEPDLMAAGLPIDFRKVKVATMTGSLYRQQHRAMNLQLREIKNLKLTVQNPLLKCPDEMDSIFIPHAVDTDSLKPGSRRRKMVGTYKPINAKAKPMDEELALLQDALKEYPEWSIHLHSSMPWQERMAGLSECGIFVQDIHPHIGYWGRSALEACALGVPTISHFSEDAVRQSEGKIEGIPIFNTERDSIGALLKKLIPDEGFRDSSGRESRRWIENRFSYPVVGRMYSDLYVGAL